MKSSKNYFSEVLFISIYCVLVWGCTRDIFVDDVGDENEDNVVDSDSSLPETDSTDLVSICEQSSTDPMAAAPVDIVVAVDNSGGMDVEAGLVQELLSSFLSQLKQAGIDATITLITAPTPSEEPKEKNGICIAAPIGSGQCPDDSNPPVYVHIPQVIESRDALSIIYATYEQWGTRVRDGSRLHFIVVSDDNADDSAQTFVEWMAAAAPPINSFFFHAITSFEDKATACEVDPPQLCCDYGAKKGTEYQSLATTTGGITADLCLQDFSQAFTDILGVIVMQRCSNASSVQITAS